MLQSLFKASGSIYMRVLFGVLLIAFIIFGIGDVFRNKTGSGDVATVGDHHITPDQLMKQMQQQTRQYQGRIDMATLKRIGYLDHVLEGMIDTIVMEMAAHDEGLVVGDKQAIEEIEKIPVFQDEKTHRLDKERFQRVLAANQINEAEFVAYLKRETATKLLADSELPPMPVPDALTDASYRFQGETRRGQIVRISNSAMAVPAPTPEQLSDYYHKHEAQFTAPEYRDFSFLTVNLQSVAGKVTISPDELKQAYDARQADFKVPERRALSQVVVKDEDQAKAVYAATQGGKSLAAAAKESGAAETPIDLGLMAKSDLPEMLADPVFAAAANTVVAPIQSPLGWHVIAVQRIEPGHALSFDEAKDALESDLKAEKARDGVAATAKQIDDQLAGGASLAEAGKPFGLTPVSVKDVDAQGKHPDGSFAPELKGKAAIVKAAFETAKDAPAQISQDGKDAAFAVTVEAIAPPTLRPLDDVKAKAIEGYTAEAKAKAATDKAAALIAKSKTGSTFDDLAQQADSPVTAIGPILRSTKDKAISPRILAALFTLTRVGDVAVASTGAGPVLVKLTEITPPPPLNAADKAAIEKTLQTQIQNDMTLQYEKALREVYKVKIDRAVLEKMKATN
jgi:peptidyl-prolyl cis-trans isomerase D